MSEKENSNNAVLAVVGEKMKELTDFENFQKYVMGTKKNGNPRAAFDIVLEIMDRRDGGKKKHKKHKKHKNKDKNNSAYSFYLDVKKKKKKKHGKHWHI